MSFAPIDDMPSGKVGPVAALSGSVTANCAPNAA